MWEETPLCTTQCVGRGLGVRGENRRLGVGGFGKDEFDADEEMGAAAGPWYGNSPGYVCAQANRCRVPYLSEQVCLDERQTQLQALVQHAYDAFILGLLATCADTLLVAVVNVVP